MLAGPKAKVLLPLYIFPDPGVWDPLYKAVNAHPTLDFIIIINPNSGPGSAPWWPNEDYVREIPKLNAYPNVKTVGYVAIHYCNRPISEVFAEIETYAGWSGDKRYPGIGVEGIFFDETPNEWSADVDAYLCAITEKARCEDGLLGKDGKHLCIHNPGTAVDRRFVHERPDITTTAEVSYSVFRTKDYQRWLATSPVSRSHTSYMINSVPEDKVREFVFALSERAEYLFITDLETNFYASFGKSWGAFIEVMAK